MRRFGGLVWFGFLAVMGGHVPVWGEVRLAFDFNGIDPVRNLPWTNTSVLAEGWRTTGWTMGDGLSLVAARDHRLAFAASSGEELSTLQDAVDDHQFLAVSITTTNFGGHRIRFTIRRESWNAPLGYAVRSSLDGFSQTIFNSALLENSDDATDHFTFLLPVNGWTHLAGAVEFRLYPYAARYDGHAASLIDFRIETAAPARTLLLESSGGGTASAEPDRSLFEVGETAALRAMPAEGYKFAGWSGSVRGRGNPRVVSVTNDMNIIAQFARKASPRMELGGNLESVTDYAATPVFRNVFNRVRPWLTREVDSFAWESSQTPPVDHYGWPLEIPFSAPDASTHIVHTLALLHDSGEYIVRFDGQGEIHLRPPGVPTIVLTNGGGRFQATADFNVTPEAATLLIEIHASSAHDPVRDIEIIASSHDDDLAEHPFHPGFIDSISPYRLLRFMDWMRTNGNPLEHWTNRTTASHYTQARGEGVAHEYMIQLCNLTAKDAWICIPHRADDEYIRQTARLYRDTLETNLVLYVEYSNETWNSMPDFSQTIYVQEQAGILGISADEFVARRSAEIFGIFAEEYGSDQKYRYVNVLGAMAGFFSGVSLPRVVAINQSEHNPGHHYPDAIAIAPYFGINFTPDDAPFPSAEELVTMLSSNSIAESIAFAVTHKTLADEQGMRLICYEGGQHFTGILGAENDDELTTRIFQANRDARMEHLYQIYLAGLESAGVDLFANFTHISNWSKWGTWGVLEYQGQPPEEAPKWRALTNWVESVGDGRPVIELASPGASPTLSLELRPDRNYALSTSDDLITWVSMPEWEGLRGDDVLSSMDLPMPDAERLFWRIEVSR